MGRPGGADQETGRGPFQDIHLGSWGYGLEAHAPPELWDVGRCGEEGVTSRGRMLSDAMLVEGRSSEGRPTP